MMVVTVGLMIVSVGLMIVSVGLMFVSVGLMIVSVGLMVVYKANKIFIKCRFWILTTTEMQYKIFLKSRYYNFPTMITAIKKCHTSFVSCYGNKGMNNDGNNGRIIDRGE